MTAVLDRAACAGAPLNEFFPARSRPGASPRFSKILQPVATRYCQTCPVIAACHQLAERTGSTGLFGGSWWPHFGDPVPLVPAAEQLTPRRYS